MKEMISCPLAFSLFLLLQTRNRLNSTYPQIQSFSTSGLLSGVLLLGVCIIVARFRILGLQCAGKNIMVRTKGTRTAFPIAAVNSILISNIQQKAS
jgi:hypothetical protein